jgi:rare lipoprotein A
MVIDSREPRTLASSRMRTSAVIILPLALLLAGCAKKAPAPRAATFRPGYTETGIASWYGPPYHGRRAADGSVYDMDQMTAAHRTMPFGTRVKVTNLTNTRACEVRITDRGPFAKDRIIDLSRAAAKSIDMIGPGTARVRLLVLKNATPRPGEPAYAVQVAVYRDKERAEKLLRDLKKTKEPVALVERQGDVAQWRVLVGRKATSADAEALAERVRSYTGSAYVVRLDD